MTETVLCVLSRLALLAVLPRALPLPLPFLVG